MGVYLFIIQWSALNYIIGNCIYQIVIFKSKVSPMPNQ